MFSHFSDSRSVSSFRGQRATIQGRRQPNRGVQRMTVGCFSSTMSDGLVPLGHVLAVYFSLFLPETNESVEKMDSTVVECVTLKCQSPEAEAEAEAAAPSDGASAGASAGCEGQEVTPTSSPDTNSPVMISVEVGRLQITTTYPLKVVVVFFIIIRPHE